MNRARALSACVLIVGGCSKPSEPLAAAPTLATTRPTSTPASGPALQAVDARYGIYLARFETHISVTPTGWLRGETTGGKRYHRNDGHWHELWEIREGQLSPAQMADLANLFVDWDRLSDSYGGVPDGGNVEFRHGDKLVKGGSDVPEQVRAALQKVRELSDAMPPTATESRQPYP